MFRSIFLLLISLLVFGEASAQKQWVSDTISRGYIVRYEVATQNGEVVKYEEWYDGKIRTEGQYRDGVKTGVWKFHRMKGDAIEVDFTNSKNTGGSISGRHNSEVPDYPAMSSLPTQDSVDSGNASLDSTAQAVPDSASSTTKKPEVMPEFPGGSTALMKYLAGIPYPELAQQLEIEGTVLVEFVVTKYGYVDSIRITRHVHALLEQVVMKYMQLMPRWDPGLSEGKHYVPVYFSVPITFKLEPDAPKQKGK